ncbi:MAG: M20/M25/M40 family metallo-hydrolase [Butyrivibrio sp.]|uniref:M20/M25/M40 family metallo-hydrolase n=1 Tax=Butyrivibrio sp. TaxID=28121 RepID=UPI0025D37A6C|nr:M20/M25/M40 family metallo-hydrolase [Butyrivibrio sp.]MCR5770064.1 M20/M25/M40 family metallo-hydrolase [Butyrivibrio sp.]
MKEELIELTKSMVKVPSVNGTSGEHDIGVFIENYLRDIPYFKKHSDQVIIQSLKDDPLNRRSVFALLKGEKDDNKKTIIFHGHTDTVGVEDYGDLAEYAFDCDKLMERLSKIQLPDDVRWDLESGEYIFGRGACDMKSGDAVFMVLIKHIAEHIEDFSGNILLSCNPVEENLHTGIIEGIDTLIDLKNKHDLEYVLAINNDYTCPMYQGDKHQYIYTGVVGKLLPCFYVRGRETHVGQCFEGFDPTTVVAGLVKKINLNPEFSDGYKGEYSLPPTVLKMKDLKPWYNVQTAKEAFVYFNYFVHNKGMEDIVAGLMDSARSAVKDSLYEYNSNYQKYCSLSGKDYTAIDYPCHVMTFEELRKLADKNNKTGEDIDELLTKITKEQEDKGVDKREIPIELIRTLLSKAGIYESVVVMYFAAPYCPHNTLQDADEELIQRLGKITKEIEQEENVEYNIHRFFPSLSDSSYLAIDDSESSIEHLKQNFPQMDSLYPLPIDKIRSLGIKAVNFGVHGKDAHKWTERLYVPYSFDILPKLIQKALKEFL